MSFYHWLILGKDLDDPIGDFARDALRFPRSIIGMSYESLDEYFKGTHSDVYRAFKEAWREYMRL